MQLQLDEASEKWTCTERTRNRNIEIILEPAKLDDKHHYLFCAIYFDDTAYIECDVFKKFNRITKSVIRKLCKHIIKSWKENIGSRHVLDVLQIEHICYKVFGRKSIRIFLFKRPTLNSYFHVASYLEFTPHLFFSHLDSRSYVPNVEDFSVMQTPFSRWHKIITN